MCIVKDNNNILCCEKTGYRSVLNQYVNVKLFTQHFAHTFRATEMIGFAILVTILRIGCIRLAFLSYLSWPLFLPQVYKTVSVQQALVLL